MDEVMRGKTPEKIEQICQQLCNDYLWGQWTQIQKNDLTVKRLSGGFTNQNYLCSLSNNIKVISDEPNCVLIKFFEKKHALTGDDSHDDEDRFNDGIIALFVAEKRLGPNILGIFKNGLIMEYIENQRFELSHLKDKQIVKELAQKLAKFHFLKVPIKQTNDYFISLLDKMFELAFDSFPMKELFIKNNAKKLENNDLKIEINWIKDMVNKSKTPVVFSHNDFRGVNILVKTNYESENRIMLCDFENSRYGLRGSDFGSILSLWSRECDDFALYWSALYSDDFPKNLPQNTSDSDFRQFIDEYIKESILIRGNDYAMNEMNSSDRILAESKLFLLLNKIFVILCLLKVNEGHCGEEMDKTISIKFAEYLYGHYFELKNDFTQQNIFNTLGITE